MIAIALMVDAVKDGESTGSDITSVSSFSKDQIEANEVVLYFLLADRIGLVGPGARANQFSQDDPTGA